MRRPGGYQLGGRIRAPAVLRAFACRSMMSRTIGRRCSTSATLSLLSGVLALSSSQSSRASFSSVRSGVTNGLDPLVHHARVVPRRPARGSGSVSLGGPLMGSEFVSVVYQVFALSIVLSVVASIARMGNK